MKVAPDLHETSGGRHVVVFGFQQSNLFLANVCRRPTILIKVIVGSRISPVIEFAPQCFFFSFLFFDAAYLVD